jgi:dienelactone hydrolase
VNRAVGIRKEAKAGLVRAKVLVLHGAVDPFVPPAEVAAFEAEMGAAGADWQLVSCGGAVHSFTHREAGDDPAKGAAYDARADRRS